MPKRIQRRRTKGWRMPPEAVYVGRPTKWGNPYRVGDSDPMLAGHTLTAAGAVRMFEWYLAANPKLKAEAVKELRGKDLVCWCGLDGERCHADVWLAVVNGD